MNIKQFVEESEREFDEKFVRLNSNGVIPVPPEIIKHFYSRKLRELIGEVRCEVEKLRPEKCDCTDEKGGYECEHWGAHETVDSVLHLLDEAGEGK